MCCLCDIGSMDQIVVRVSVLAVADFQSFHKWHQGGHWYLHRKEEKSVTKPEYNYILTTLLFKRLGVSKNCILFIYLFYRNEYPFSKDAAQKPEHFIFMSLTWYLTTAHLFVLIYHNCDFISHNCNLIISHTY